MIGETTVNTGRGRADVTLVQNLSTQSACCPIRGDARQYLYVSRCKCLGSKGSFGASKERAMIKAAGFDRLGESRGVYAINKAVANDCPDL